MSELNTTQHTPFWYVDTLTSRNIALFQEINKNISILNHLVSSSNYILWRSWNEFASSGSWLASSIRYYCGECGCDVTDCDGWCGCGSRPTFPLV